MLHTNIQNLRKSHGLSQEDLAAQLHVARQTISKWERGLSIPDSGMLIELSEALDVPVSTLLGEAIPAQPTHNIEAIAKKLEIINEQLFQRQQEKYRNIHRWFIALLAVSVAALVFVLAVELSSGLPFEITNPADAQMALLNLMWIVFEKTVLILSPLAIIGSIAGIIFNRKNC